MMPDIRLPTARLEVIAESVELARAELQNRARFARLLAARVPENWPPPLDTADSLALRLSPPLGPVRDVKKGKKPTRPSGRPLAARAPRRAGRCTELGPVWGQRQHVRSLLRVGIGRLFDKGTVRRAAQRLRAPPGA